MTDRHTQPTALSPKKIGEICLFDRFSRKLVEVAKARVPVALPQYPECQENAGYVATVPRIHATYLFEYLVWPSKEKTGKDKGSSQVQTGHGANRPVALHVFSYNRYILISAYKYCFS
ncbi:hypothetical protein EKK70_00265 [Desulfovibrio sp. DS-1]|nr:hypothetical protein EKK70_00265 [Desulfovibrio sp. DS-1]